MSDSFGLMDGIIVTVVAMAVVFIVLSSLWGLMELVRRLVVSFSKSSVLNAEPIETETKLVADPEREKIAVLAALTLAYNDHPTKKYEIIEVNRVK
ncbi:OadG family protein [Jeotgalibaca ciconiae]|uniref:Uncharacterized protein n=1 Tax=Jeotgalibaca ciconiae TaxID=2496265 RepID=A0A3S9H9I1_9LACT|nr:OadG family protein [Jeotgalibaca ciconiae]AZP03951.1 hypothetical protein EJN90_04285 [Jeotgalibaca ciconiae]